MTAHDVHCANAAIQRDDYDDDTDNDDYDDDDGDDGDDKDESRCRHVTLAASVNVLQLKENGHESTAIFRNWVTKSASEESCDGSLTQLKYQNTISNRCHGIRLALNISIGFLSEFHSCWNVITTALSTSVSCNDTIPQIVQLLLANRWPAL